MFEVPSECRNIRNSFTVEIDAVSERVLAECLSNTCKEYLENDTVVFELYLCLCRVDIDIKRLRIHIHIYEIRRCDTFRNEVLICLHDCLVQVWTAEIATIDKEILVAQHLSCRIRTAHITPYADYRCLGLYVHNIIDNIGSQHILYPELQRLGRSEDIHILTIVSKGESYIGTGKGYSREFRYDVLELHVI